MLHQISWFTYGSAIILIAITYYAYVGLTFYRSELRALRYRLTGKKPPVSQFSGGDFPIPAYDVAGAIQPDDVDFVSQDELSFGPPEESEAPVIQMPVASAATNPQDIHLLGDFSEMISEVKTLIRVISESGESKENFEMLFRLIVQKYLSLKGTPYETQLNDYLINEGAPQFPFSLTIADLQAYWIIDNDKNQRA
jgi:hypothetical protein